LGGGVVQQFACALEFYLECCQRKISCNARMHGIRCDFIGNLKLTLNF
jgi:hypothetical protein